MQTTHDAEEPATMTHDSSHPRVQSLGSDKGSLILNELMVLYTTLSKTMKDLQSDLKQTKLSYGAAYTKLIMRVKKLEHKVKSSQPIRRARIVISDTEEDLEDPSKQGGRIVEINQNPSISLVQDEGTSWIQEDAEIQGRTSADTEILLDQEEPTELVEEEGSLVVVVRVEKRNYVTSDRSAGKRVKDKGKAFRKKMNLFNKKEKKQLDPAMLRYHALQNRSFSVAKVRKNMCMYLKNQEGYKQSHFKGMSYGDIRLIFKRVWDQNHAFVPKVSEIEKEVMKRPRFDKIKGSSKKRSREDSDEDNAKKQKLEDDAEKEELRDSMDVVPRDDIAIDVESLASKYPIVNWKTHVLTKNMMYYQIIRADESSKNYKIFSEMLDDFDMQDVMDLHRLLQERYDTTSPEGYDLLLWGDLKILFEANEEDEIMNATSRVRRPRSRESQVAQNVLDNSKNEKKNVAVYVRKNKQEDVILNKENVIDVDVANASKAKTLLCVSCMKNVFIPCHDKCVAKHKLN
ncbi:hypothetical protein Tco_0594184, partial [Tanacetum coccineum]